mmetsp:Transcript_68671/g.221846  ORF Transcript_68671/g.221846 Transcript_68671/m.221846 type:complete len:225 (+) Transcript_68671:561-1235(+)
MRVQDGRFPRQLRRNSLVPHELRAQPRRCGLRGRMVDARAGPRRRRRHRRLQLPARPRRGGDRGPGAAQGAGLRRGAGLRLRTVWPVPHLLGQLRLAARQAEEAVLPQRGPARAAHGRREQLGALLTRKWAEPGSGSRRRPKAVPPPGHVHPARRAAGAVGRQAPLRPRGGVQRRAAWAARRPAARIFRGDLCLPSAGTCRSRPLPSRGHDCKGWQGGRPRPPR